jgi:hypothetical protein
MSVWLPCTSGGYRQLAAETATWQCQNLRKSLEAHAAPTQSRRHSRSAISLGSRFPPPDLAIASALTAQIRRGPSLSSAMSRRLALLALLACLVAASAGAAADTASGAMPPQAGGRQQRPSDPAKTTAEEEAANEALDQDTPDDGSAGFIGQPAASCDAAALSSGVALAGLVTAAWQCAVPESWCAVQNCDLLAHVSNR